MENVETNSVGADKRRSTRVIHSTAITVKGLDALDRPFRESTKTLMVNCYGCKYESAHYPAPNSGVMIEIRHAKPGRPSRVVPARVIWVQRPKHYRALYQIGAEFEVPGNVWDIALPPEDWFPCPEDEELVIPESTQENLLNAERITIPASEIAAENPAGDSDLGALPVKPALQAIETLLLSDESEAHARRLIAENREVQSEAMRQFVKLAASEAIAEEIALMRQRIDTHLHEAIDRAVETLIERITQSAALRNLNLENPSPGRDPRTESEAAPDQASANVSSIPMEKTDPNQSASSRRRARRARKQAGPGV